MPSYEPRNDPQDSADNDGGEPPSAKRHPNQPTPATIMQALVLASAHWETKVATAAMSHQTFREYAQIGERFLAFAAAHGIVDLDRVTPALAQAFIQAPGRDRHGRLIPVPAPATSRQRSSALEALFRSSRMSGLTTAAPLSDTPKIPRTPRKAGTTLRDHDIAAMRFHAEAGMPATRNASLLALAEAGLTSAEVAAASTADLDLPGARVWTDGTHATDARYCPLDSWSARVLAMRADYLTRTALANGPQLLVTSATSDYRRQASVGSGFIEIARHAGLRTSSRTVVFRDVTRYIARRVFAQTGQLSEVAARLGLRSLEVAAAYASYDWPNCGGGTS